MVDCHLCKVKEYFMKKLIFPILFVLSLSLRAQADDTSLTYTDHFYLALEHYHKKRFQLAENEFKNILIDKRNFEDPASHFMLAKTQYNLGKMKVSERTCNSYLNKYPRSMYEPNVKSLLGDILISKKKIFICIRTFIIGEAI